MKYVIDIPKYQQLYVRYSTKNEKEELLSILTDMQFDLSEGIKKDAYDFPIITINYLDKTAFGSNVTCMASAMQSGAVVLSIGQFVKAFYPYLDN
jgi:hypothetical protein